MKQKQMITPWTFYGKEKQLDNGINDKKQESSNSKSKNNNKNNKNQKERQNFIEAEGSKINLESKSSLLGLLSQDSSNMFKARNQGEVSNSPSLVTRKSIQHLNQANFPGVSQKSIDKQKAITYKTTNQLIVLKTVKQYLKMEQYFSSSNGRNKIDARDIRKLNPQLNIEEQNSLQDEGSVIQQYQTLPESRNLQNKYQDEATVQKQKFMNYEKLKKSQPYHHLLIHLDKDHSINPKSSKWQNKLKQLLYTHAEGGSANEQLQSNQTNSVSLGRSLDRQAETINANQQPLKLPKIKSTSFQRQKKVLLQNKLKHKIALNQINESYNFYKKGESQIKKKMSRNNTNVMLVKMQKGSNSHVPKGSHKSIQLSHLNTNSQRQLFDDTQIRTDRKKVSDFDSDRHPRNARNINIKIGENHYYRSNTNGIQKTNCNNKYNSILDDATINGQYHDHINNAKDSYNNQDRNVIKYSTIGVGNNQRLKSKGQINSMEQENNICDAKLNTNQHTNNSNNDLQPLPIHNRHNHINQQHEIKNQDNQTHIDKSMEHYYNKLKIKNLQRNNVGKKSMLLSPKKKLLSMLLSYDQSPERMAIDSKKKKEKKLPNFQDLKQHLGVEFKSDHQKQQE